MQLELDSRLETLSQQFLLNNPVSGNFGSLILKFLSKATELLALSDGESNLHAWKTFNALFMIRTFIKYVIETGSEYQLLQHFEAMPSEEEQEVKTDDCAINMGGGAEKSQANKIIDGSKFETFFEALVNVIVVIPVKEYTYHLHLEAVNTIITLLSVHLSSSLSPEKSTIFRTIYKSQYANTLMSTLLHFVSRLNPAPAQMFGAPGGSFVFGIAESLWSMLTFSKKTPDILTVDLPSKFREHFPLANQSLLLILILTNHHTLNVNLYRSSLFACTDATEPTQEDLNSFKIDFASLYNTLGNFSLKFM